MPAVLDHDILDTLRALQRPGKPDVLARVLDLYESESERLMAELRRAMVENNIELLFRSAHSLKTTNNSVGAVHAAELCRQLEALAQAGQSVGAAEAELAGQIEAAISEAKIALARYQASLLP
jgi:HPt (histidine-containing phosphotransfer) domain-containing protein